MNQRQAKKVLRYNLTEPSIRCRASTWHEAQRANRRAWMRGRERIYGGLRQDSRYTPGHRWGRWDPAQPSPPWEVPF